MKKKTKMNAVFKHIQILKRKKLFSLLIILIVVFATPFSVVSVQYTAQYIQNAAMRIPTQSGKTVTIEIVHSPMKGNSSSMGKGSMVNGMMSMGFMPKVITITAGTTVIWVNKDHMIHTTTSIKRHGQETWDSGKMKYNDIFMKTFSAPGDYHYHCDIHDFMRGVIHVIPSVVSPIMPMPSANISQTPVPSITGMPSAMPSIPSPQQNPSPTTNPNPQSFSGINVQGNALVNDQGQQIQLHGVVRETGCSINNGIFNRPTDLASIQVMKNWHINAVMIDAFGECWLNSGIPTPSLAGAPYQKAITDYINLLAQNNIYTIFRTYNVGFSDRQTVLAFWTQVASSFKNSQFVLFEVASTSPSSQKDTPADWECWRDGTTPSNTSTCETVITNKRTGGTTIYIHTGTQDVVNAIRSTGAQNVIILHGIQGVNSFMSAHFSTGVPESLTGWLQYKPNDPINNIAAGVRVYHFDSQNTSPCDQVSCWDGMITPVASQVPVIDDYLTERNVYVTGTSCDASWMNTFMIWLDNHLASYFASSWDASSGAYGCNTPYYNLLMDNNGSPSALGQIYKNHISSF